MIDQSRPRRPSPGIAEFAPVPRERRRHGGWTPDRQQRFIAALADLGSVRAAAHAVNMTPESAYQLRRHPEGGPFREAWEASLALGIQRLEDVAMDRALNGVEVPVYSYGKLIGSRRVYNDALLMFLLRNRAADRFSADSLNSPDAATRGQIERLKREWRKEWEEERARESSASAEQATHEINRKLETMRQRWLASMTRRTRALYEAYKAAEDEDTANSRSAFTEELDESETWDEEGEGAWNAEETEQAPPIPSPSGGEGPRALPDFLTHGDSEAGLPRPTLRKRLQSALGAPEDDG